MPPAAGDTTSYFLTMPWDATVRESFATYPDGGLSRTRSGLEYAVWPRGDEYLTVQDGLLRLPENSSPHGGSYASVDVGAAVHRIGATFSFEPYSEPGGVLALVAWETDIGDSRDAQAIPASPLHFTISPTDWALGVFPADSDQLIYLHHELLQTPLVADGKTQYGVQVALDSVRGTATVSLSGRQDVVISDPRLAAPATLACVEPFLLPGTTDAARPLVSQWWVN